MSEAEISLRFSGWRFIPHSHAVVCQFECLEILRRGPQMRLYFEDAPYWNPSWQPMPGMFSAQAEKALRSMPAPPVDLKADAELRFGCPYDLLGPPRAERTAVFGTTEALTIPPQYVQAGVSLREAQRRHGHRILTCSNWSKQGFVRGGLPPESVLVLPLGVDPEVFRPATDDQRRKLRAAAGIAPEDFIFLNVGAMTPNKGLRYLLLAFAEVVRVRPQARLLLKGMDSLYTSSVFIDQHMQALDPASAQLAAGRLSYVGEGLSFAGMAGVYQSADCYVTPYVAEGFNLPALEAAACGLPLICTAGGPTDDFVTDEFALRIESKLRPITSADQPPAMGLLPNKEHLVQHMLKAMDDAAFCRAARAAGPAHVAARFTWEKVMDGLLPMLLGARS